MGSVCLIGQDKFNTYSDIIYRCFIAEGITHKHFVFVADLEEDLSHLKQRIPSVNKSEPESTSSQKKSDSDELRIAWRYQSPGSSAPPTEKLNKTLQANYFVMNKLMSETEVEDLNIAAFRPNDIDNFNVSDNHSGLNTMYIQLAHQIKSHIDSINMNINKTKKYNNICRIVINSIGGLLWNDKSTFDEDYSVSLCQFLLYLRYLLRHSLAIVLITVPNEILQNERLMERCAHLSDYFFTMDDSKSSISRLTKTEYNGLFRLSKLPHLNSLNAFQPETLDLAFYLKRKRLVVEQLHLPPDLGEDDDTKKGRTSTTSDFSCGSGSTSNTSSKLDF